MYVGDGNAFYDDGKGGLDMAFLRREGGGDVAVTRRQPGPS